MNTEVKSKKENSGFYLKRNRKAGVILFFCLLFFLVLGVSYHIKKLGAELESSARDSLYQGTEQFVDTISATWTSDAANLKEISGVLANTDNKDTVMQGIEKNDVVYRYLFVEKEDNEGVASDGTSLQKNDSHQFTKHPVFDDVEISEAFLSKSGKWCYLYRTPVELDGEMYGWVYAQYLYDRVHFIFSDSYFFGNGNYLIYDIKSDSIVFQQDETNFDSIVGISLDAFMKDILSGSDEVVAAVNNTVESGTTLSASYYLNHDDSVLCMIPLSGKDYYVIGVASEDAVLKGARIVRLTYLFSAFIIAALFICIILVQIVYRVREKARHSIECSRIQHEKEMQNVMNEAIAANESKSKFLANMSHEIRTPINAIIGMNEMIIREHSNPKVEEYAKDIYDASQALLQIVNDILDITKIETGKMELVLIEYNISDMINGVRKLILPRAQKKNLPLVLNIDENFPCKLFGDEVRIRQIITNLVTNAVKYTEEGQVTINVTGTKKNNTEIVHFCVEDTGIGIKEEDIPKLIEKFNRIEESRNRNIEGTGLGLNITTELLKLMGSELQIESVYGKGSKFSFDLVQDIVDETPVGKVYNKNERKASKKYSASFTAPSARILVVDDNRMNLKIACKLLESTLMQIDTAISGQECLDKAGDTKYDIILMDHMMPYMDGVETFRRLKEEEGINRDSVVIALTANAIVGSKEEYLALGFDDYLSKPIDYAELEKTLKRFIPVEKIAEPE